MSRSDASRTRRFSAAFVDIALISLPAAAIGYFATPYVGQFALRFSVATLNRSVRTLASTGDLAAAGTTLAGSLDTFGRFLGGASIAILLVLLFGMFLYTWIAHSRSGRTLGKAMFGISVVRSDGRRPDILRALVRSLLLYAPPFYLLVLAMSSIITDNRPDDQLVTILGWVAFGGLLIALLPGRRTLHDWLTGTVVTRT